MNKKFIKCMKDVGNMCNFCTEKRIHLHIKGSVFLELQAGVFLTVYYFIRKLI
jgi:hypothetical protein